MFEIVVFIASQSIYVEQLLDIMDPNRKLISHQAYRESCIFSNGSYTKDLTVLGVDLAKISVIDNSPWVDFLPIDFHIMQNLGFDLMFRESLYEDEEFDQRQLAALLVSKVFYYLGELNDSLSYALGAGPMFDVSEDSDYVHSLLAKAIDEYANVKSKAAESNDEAAKMDPRLEAIVERMLYKCILDGKYQQAIGMAIEYRRLDKLEEAIMRSDNIHATLSYCINISHSFVNMREYRHELFSTCYSNNYTCIDLMPVETRIGKNFPYKATTVIAAADQIAFHILGVLEAFFGIETHNFAVQWPDRG
ncbi:hypothetical protein LOK49_LG11G01104 [Camellia lanceoleosa]|uniref:Uncharacterized protein n=1 Tax=Camellia lanceoleosa TaxID=1840588 RepID=A0ACC0G0V1_9ERIC|nr:hypothetical protein LOK49_LG11G01104 [Camellia lanceoleosa]